MTTEVRQGAARAIADVTAGTILATVDIAAPPERVFRALTDGDEIVRWWGSPEAYRTTEWVSDLRKGGRFRASGAMPDGSRFSLQGEFVEIDPPRTLAHTWEPDWVQGAPTLVTYRLEQVGNGTRVTLRHEGFGDRRDACASHATGWQSVLSWLDAFAAPREPSSLRYFVLRLLSPRPTFPMDMTPDEARIMQAHVGYWTNLLGQGTAVAFGPVMDPEGPWGLGVVGVKDEKEIAAIEAGDPVITAAIGFRYKVLPMMRAIVRGQ